MSEKKTKLKVGDYVLGKYGTGTIQKMELCENVGDKYGINVSEVWLTDIDRVVVDLENNRFEYGKDLDFINY
jgi:FAD synthase|tara:strand:+ start:159 stop:374 length:216 start_codon:yes stop_codon:yes gene_type:complete